MNEIMERKYLKKVMSYGIPKSMAKEIVDTAIETSKGKNVELFIDYAMTLTYGIGFSQKHAK